jgi:hypothetical protein
MPDVIFGWRKGVRRRSKTWTKDNKLWPAPSVEGCYQVLAHPRSCTRPQAYGLKNRFDGSKNCFARFGRRDFSLSRFARHMDISGRKTASYGTAGVRDFINLYRTNPECRAPRSECKKLGVWGKMIAQRTFVDCHCDTMNYRRLFGSLVQ